MTQTDLVSNLRAAITRKEASIRFRVTDVATINAALAVLRTEGKQVMAMEPGATETVFMLPAFTAAPDRRGKSQAKAAPSKGSRAKKTTPKGRSKRASTAGKKALKKVRAPKRKLGTTRARRRG